MRRRILRAGEPWPPSFRDDGSHSLLQSKNWLECTVRCLGVGRAKTFFFEFADGTHVVFPTVEFATSRVLCRCEALPFTLYGEPIIRGHWSELKGMAILKFILSGRCVELRFAQHPLAPPLAFATPDGVANEVRTAETHVLNLATTWEEMWNNRFSQRIRNQVRRAEKEQLIVREATTSRDVDNFYALHVASCKDWGYDKPLHTRRFFQELMAGCPQGLRMLLVEHQDQLVAGGIFIRDRGSVLYWQGAMDREAKQKYPVYLLLADVIRGAIMDGIQFLNMGASGNLQGVKNFKELWGARPVSYELLTFKREKLVRRVNTVRRGCRTLRDLVLQKMVPAFRSQNET